MNQLGGRSNTGEGGEDLRSIASSPRGHRNQAEVASRTLWRPLPIILSTPKELEIKMAQARNPAKAANCPRKK